MTIDLIPDEKVAEFLKFRPATRIVYYCVKPDGTIKVMLGFHKKNQAYTLPGGRFDNRDLTGYALLRDAIWHETMFREMLEELGEDDMGIFAAMFAGNFDNLGTVLWRHHKTGAVCVDFVAAIRCDDEVNFQPPLDSELSHITWVDWTEEKISPYENIGQAIELLYDCVRGRLSFNGPHVNFSDEELTEDEAAAVCKKINELLN